MGQLFMDAKKPPPVYPGYRIPPSKTTFRVSFVEIYNEDLIDLLVKGDFRPPVTIREDARGNIFWTGVQEIVVSSVEEVIQYVFCRFLFLFGFNLSFLCLFPCLFQACSVVLFAPRGIIIHILNIPLESLLAFSGSDLKTDRRIPQR